MDVFSSRVRWCPNLLFRFPTKMFELPRYTTDFWGYAASKNVFTRAEKHANFTGYQTRRHPVRYVATDVSARFCLHNRSIRTYLLCRLHFVTIHNSLNLMFKTVRTSEVQGTCYFLQTLNEEMFFKQLVTIINFLFWNLLSMIYNQIIVHSNFSPLPITNIKTRIMKFKFSLLICVSVCVQVEVLSRFHELCHENRIKSNGFKFIKIPNKMEKRRTYVARERHCRNLLLDFEINTCKKIFTKYEHWLKLICVCVCVCEM